ncbi:MAG TPA: hypothetical protein VM261_06905 [Kofleriaceae bacterium]|nr:hypothetical protein [Kofleriaceae bacterium]
MLAVVGGSSVARAEAPAAGDSRVGDNRGVLVSGAIFGGTGDGIAVGAEGSLGWGVTRWLAPIARASIASVFDRNDGWRELQLGARVWPEPVATPWFSFELHGGHLTFSEEYECPFPSTPPGTCYGGTGTGYSYGVAGRVQVRSRHASFDVFLGHDRMHWRDFSEGYRDHASFTRAGLGFSFY